MDSSKVYTKLKAYWLLSRFDSIAVILLLFLPGLWSLVIASQGQVSWALVLIFFIGSALCSAAGCIVNDMADRKFDKEVERTKGRMLVTGEVTMKEATALVLVMLLICVGLLSFLNPLCFYLSLIAVFLSATYPFMKRIFAIPQLYLALAYSFAVPMAFAAVLNDLPPVEWILYVLNFCWVMAYDTTYAIADKPDDLKIGIKTSPIFFGRFDVAAVMVFYALFLLGWLALGYFYLHANAFFYVGIVLAALLALLQYPRIRHRDRNNATASFLFNKWIGLVIAVAVIGHYYC